MEKERRASDFGRELASVVRRRDSETRRVRTYAYGECVFPDTPCSLSQDLIAANYNRSFLRSPLLFTI